MKLRWSIPVTAAIGAALCCSVPANADPSTTDLAVEAAFCHDVRLTPTVYGVRNAAVQMIRIYGNPDKAAAVAYEAVTVVCPDLRPVVIAAVDSSDWTGGTQV